MYIVTGITIDGKRFKIVTDSKIHAHGINLWRGSVWIETNGGKRKLLKRVYCV